MSGYSRRIRENSGAKRGIILRRVKKTPKKITPIRNHPCRCLTSCTFKEPPAHNCRRNTASMSVRGAVVKSNEIVDSKDRTLCREMRCEILIVSVDPVLVPTAWRYRSLEKSATALSTTVPIRVSMNECDTTQRQWKTRVNGMSCETREMSVRTWKRIQEITDLEMTDAISGSQTRTKPRVPFSRSLSASVK